MMHSNMSYVSKLKSHKKIIISKVRPEKFQFEFIEHTNRFICLTLMITTTRAALDSNKLSAKGLKQSAQITCPRRHFCNRNNDKYMDGRFKSVTTGKKMMNELQKLIYRLYSFCSGSMKYKTIV